MGAVNVQFAPGTPVKVQTMSTPFAWVTHCGGSTEAAGGVGPASTSTAGASSASARLAGRARPRLGWFDRDGAWAVRTMLVLLVGYIGSTSEGTPPAGRGNGGPTPPPQLCHRHSAQTITQSV